MKAALITTAIAAFLLGFVTGHRTEPGITIRNMKCEDSVTLGEVLCRVREE